MKKKPRIVVPLTEAAAEKRMLETWNCPISEVVDEVLGTYCIHPKSSHPRRSRDIPKDDTQTHWVSFAEDDVDLMHAMKKAAFASVKQAAVELGISAARAYRLATFVQDCRIGRPDAKGSKYQVACMVPKSILH